MADTLQIFGKTYTGVTGIKAEDGNSSTLTYIRPQGTLTISANGNGIDVSNYAAVDVNVSGGGGGATLLATKSLGTISTSSTSAADTGQTVSVSGINAYDLLVALISVTTTTNNRHIGTANTILLTAGTDVGTKNGSAIATATWNAKLSSAGVCSTRSATTKYGIYVNSCTISNGTATLAMYQRYNSTYTGTINGNYQVRVYGLKLYDLI